MRPRAITRARSQLAWREDQCEPGGPLAAARLGAVRCGERGFARELENQTPSSAVSRPDFTAAEKVS